MAKYLSSDGVLYLWQKIKLIFVQKEAGKGLSSNDYTDNEKEKVAAFEPTAYVKVTDKGQPNGVASLDSNGIIPSTQLPGFVDDVVEGYYDSEGDNFYSDEGHAVLITGEKGKIYIDVTTNISYRFGGTVYVPITSSDMSPITNSEIDEIVGA